MADGEGTATDDTTNDEEVEEEAAPERYGCPLTTHFGQDVVYPKLEEYLDVMSRIADDGFEMCLDVTAVDYLQHFDRPLPEGGERERFEVVVNLLDLDGSRRLRVRVQVPEADPTLPSLFNLYPGTEASEREVYDMFGIIFTHHPDLTRILMPEDWDGYPLRKDYAVGEIPVQFKAPHATPEVGS